jgi:protein-L-isoaspartate(D-aspartate) O-methyltransferase
MVKEQIEARGIKAPRVLEAMRSVPRHEFVPSMWQAYAYSDRPLPIGHEQTISQPFVVAFMTQALELEPGHKVLEIGTGSGYQAAVLAELAQEVYSVELLEALHQRAEQTLEQLGYRNLHLRCGDGYKGWPDQAPFDRIIVTAAPAQVPPALLEQLALGGRMVLPVGEEDQELRLLHKDADGTLRQEFLLPVRFVPMVHGVPEGESAP